MQQQSGKNQAPLIAASDFLHAATLLMLAPVALTVPVERWTSVCNAYARLFSILPAGKLRMVAGTLASMQSGPGSTEVEDGYRQCVQMMFESRLQVVDQTLRQRWRSAIRLEGAHHIDAALDRGNGAILWVSPSAFSDLIVKIGLAEAGYSLLHLSRPEHGFSQSRLGIATLNRLRTRVEDRYLHERIAIDAGSERSATLAMRRALKDNGLVSITVGANTRKPERVSLAGGELPISSGAFRLARATGADLIPVFSARTGDQAYLVRAEAPLNADGAEPGQVLQRYAALLTDYIGHHPFQARGISRFQKRAALNPD